MPLARRHALAKALLDRTANAPLALFGDTSDAAVARVLLNEARELICVAHDLVPNPQSGLVLDAWQLTVRAMEALEQEPDVERARALVGGVMTWHRTGRHTMHRGRVLVRLRRWDCLYTWEGYVHKWGQRRA